MTPHNPHWAEHDIAAHKRDRQGGWPTCDRCIEVCVAFHDEHGIGRLIPAQLRQRIAELEAARQTIRTGEAV